MTDKPSRMLIVDGMSVLKTTVGGMAYLTNGFAYNFFTQLTATIKKFEDIKGVIVCWEGGYDFRTAIYPDYKKERKGSGSEIRSQRDKVQQLLEYVGVDQAMAPGYEGDDVGAWMVHNLNVPMVLYSNDSDWLQLVKHGVSVFQKSPFSEGKKNLRVEITREKFEHYTGYPTVEDFLKAKCIFGDGDEFTGIGGVGKDVIKFWITGMPIAPAKKQKIEQFLESEEYARNRLLADLRTPRDIPIQWRRGKMDFEKALNFVREHSWNSIAAKFPDWWENYVKASL
jgi:5'-3' exonuclease